VQTSLLEDEFYITFASKYYGKDNSFNKTGWASKGAGGGDYASFREKRYETGGN